jgi:hypothetical protein
VTGNDWAEVVGAAGLFLFITVVVTVVVVQLAATARAKAALARESEYRKLAETSAESQRVIADRLDTLTEQSEHTRQRLVAIERILADVE